MKKFILFAVALVVIALVALLVLTVVEPHDIVIKRSVYIKAPKKLVLDQVIRFRNWENWGPLQQRDNTMRTTYTGTDCEIGSSLKWAGDKNTVGSGEFRITAVKDNEIDLDVHVMQPEELMATSAFYVTDSAAGSKATWEIRKHIGFPYNAGLVLINVDRLVGSDLENGLTNLRKYVEANTAMTQTEVKEIDFPAHSYQGVRKVVGWADMMPFFSESYGLLGKGLGPKISGPAVGLYFTWDTVAKNSDLMAAFPVIDTAVSVKGATTYRINASRAYMATLKGGYSGLMRIHELLGQYLAAKGGKPGLVIEEYPIGPNQEPDSNKWITNVYYLIP